MNPLDQRRFDALAGYIRSPWSYLCAHELAWFEEGSEKLLGLVSLDTVDRDYVGTVLARDAKRRFRAVRVQINLPTQFHAEAWLEDELSSLVGDPPESFFQGDEEDAPTDFFTSIAAPDKLSPAFVDLTTSRARSSALGILKELMHYFEDVDGNFVQQFQTSGFDARIWELYLYAMLTEGGYGFDRSAPAPDFHCRGLRGEFFVEATTANPSDVPLTKEEMESAEYYDSYAPIRFGSALYSKLQKRYWEKKHVQGKPLVIAIQDFHALGSMTWSSSALLEYLYGLKQIEVPGADGVSKLETVAVERYEWKGKTIPAGFFSQADAENISAVIANPGGTIAKFSRMGFLTGFGDRTLAMLRHGLAYVGEELVPRRFTTKVHDPSYTEYWAEGLSVYHNPNARIPLDEDAFPIAAHFTADGGRIMVSRQTPFFPLGSRTFILCPTK